jgi:hypothetical protein
MSVDKNNWGYDKETLLLCLAELHHAKIISGDDHIKGIQNVLKSDYPTELKEVTS